MCYDVGGVDKWEMKCGEGENLYIKSHGSGSREVEGNGKGSRWWPSDGHCSVNLITPLTSYQGSESTIISSDPEHSLTPSSRLQDWASASATLWSSPKRFIHVGLSEYLMIFIIHSRVSLRQFFLFYAANYLLSLMIQEVILFFYFYAQYFLQFQWTRGQWGD